MSGKQTEAEEAMPKRFPITDYFLHYVGKSKMQLLFFLMFMLIFPFLGVFLREIGRIIESRKLENPSYPYPEYSDFLLALTTCGLLLLIMHTFKISLRGVARSAISKRYPVSQRNDRADRLLDRLFKGIYFMFSFGFGYYIAKDLDFFPPALGGKGSANYMFDGYPYQEKQPLLREYLMIQLGYHLKSLVIHLWSKPRNDFMEMLLHHFMTVFLISLAYMMNYVNMSILVLYTHDFADIFGCFVQTFVDTDRVYCTLTSYILLLITWFYTRIWVFPNELIRAACYESTTEIHGLWLLGGMLHFLLVLHVYWYYLFLKMGYKFLKTSHAEDIQHKIETH
ncbi:unnamed protein product [Blepharisma stoltei]|uniref:TLC domain-containing protein n=1 Tax=Blepharisma stoltei TaxID=1481888 RepID=A0AAU9KG10_9CILI|nr:unnamed protein product [Blepharisma stoltei]